MIRLSIVGSALFAGLLALGPPSTAEAAAQAQVPAFLAAAVANPARPAADVARDANRKPAETLMFAGIAPGMKVAELVPGGGYYTRIISKAVGLTGHVYALVPAPRADAPADTPDFAARVEAIAAEPGYSNLSVVVEPFAQIKTPEPVDLVWTSDNYHDLHNLPGLNLTVFNQMVFDALKPGGIYLVLDHSSVPGAGITVTCGAGIVAAAWRRRPTAEIA